MVTKKKPEYIKLYTLTDKHGQDVETEDGGLEVYYDPAEALAARKDPENDSVIEWQMSRTFTGYAGENKWKKC